MRAKPSHFIFKYLVSILCCGKPAASFTEVVRKLFDSCFLYSEAFCE